MTGKMANYAIITDNGGGKDSVWHDVAGEEYYFPNSYINILIPGTLVVYHRTKRTFESPDIPDRMSDDSHYFGIARIGAVTTTPDGNYRAEILDFEKFKYPVDIHRPSGEYFEINPFFQQGVRRTVQSVYDDIIAASKVPPIPAAPKAEKRKGIKSLASLDVIRRSFTFCDDRYEIATATAGYYIYNVMDKLYYKLEKPKEFHPKWADLKVLRSSENFLITHNGTRIGIIRIINKGIEYTSLISPDLDKVIVNM